jgi:hypothetical protein
MGDAANHGHLSPVPSLFTFNIKDSRMNYRVAAQVTVKVKDTKLSRRTFIDYALGNERPQFLKLSAWGARILHDKTIS